MNRRTATAIVWFTFSCTACAGSATDGSLTPELLLHDVDNRGASVVVRDLWNRHDPWNEVTKRIASGENAWIDVALALRKGSDAGASSDLRDAMFQALAKNPAYVLQHAEPEYPLSELCEGRVDPPSTYSEAIAEQVRTEKAVEQVRTIELQEKKELCLIKLREGEGHLKRFFGMTKQ